MVISTVAGVAGWVGVHSLRSGTRHCWPPCSLVRIVVGVPVGRHLKVSYVVTTAAATETIITITVLRRRENGGFLGYLIGYKADSRDDDDKTRQLYFPLLHCFGRGCADFAQAGHRLR